MKLFLDLLLDHVDCVLVLLRSVCVVKSVHLPFHMLLLLRARYIVVFLSGIDGFRIAAIYLHHLVILILLLFPIRHGLILIISLLAGFLLLLGVSLRRYLRLVLGAKVASLFEHLVHHLTSLEVRTQHAVWNARLS